MAYNEEVEHVRSVVGLATHDGHGDGQTADAQAQGRADLLAEVVVHVWRTTNKL
jgi:hypothetical protein